MTRDKARRRPLRKQSRLDDDLIELTEALAEWRADTQWPAWFAMPWNYGNNAVYLALSVANEEAKTDLEQHLTVDAKNTLTSWVANIEMHNSGNYEIADGWCKTLKEGSALHAAFRCFQVMVARSDGGGRVYNDLLLAVFARIDPMPYANLVRVWREVDVTTHATARLSGSNSDALNRSINRLGAAFRIAWGRGLYHVAYALGR